MPKITSTLTNPMARSCQWCQPLVPVMLSHNTLLLKLNPFTHSQPICSPLDNQNLQTYDWLTNSYKTKSQVTQGSISVTTSWSQITLINFITFGNTSPATKLRSTLAIWLNSATSNSISTSFACFGSTNPLSSSSQVNNMVSSFLLKRSPDNHFSS